MVTMVARPQVDRPLAATVEDQEAEEEVVVVMGAEVPMEEPAMALQTNQEVVDGLCR